MQNLATVAAQVGVLFALMAVGAVCRRVRLVDERAVKGIVNVLGVAVGKVCSRTIFYCLACA